MPTRLDVLLQRRKSALAEPLHRHRATTARAGGRRSAKDGGFRNEGWSRIIARSYIISLKISRNPAVTVNGRADIKAAFSCKGYPNRCRRKSLFALRYGKIDDKPHIIAKLCNGGTTTLDPAQKNKTQVQPPLVLRPDQDLQS